MTANRHRPEPIEVELPGVRIAGLSWGPEAGPLALCLHGYPDTAWTWRHLGPYLAERGWRVVAPFLRGYAPSGLTADGNYQVGAVARDANQLCELLGGDERAVLIGHDWGAIAAYGAVGVGAPRFRRVVTIAVPPIDVLLRPGVMAANAGLLARQTRQSWYVLFQQLPWVPERALPRVVEGLWRVWSPGYDAEEDLAHVHESLAGHAHRVAALRYYRSFLNPLFRKREYKPEHSRIGTPPTDVPFLYIHGETDGCLLVGLAEAAAPLLPPNGRAEILTGVGHFLQLEDPGRVNPLIEEFIAA